MGEDANAVAALPQATHARGILVRLLGRLRRVDVVGELEAAAVLEP